MPLKLRIKPEGKCFINGNGWIKNVGNRPIEIILHDLIAQREDKPIEIPNSWTPTVK